MDERKSKQPFGLYDEPYTLALRAASDIDAFHADLDPHLESKPARFSTQIKQHLGRLTNAVVDALEQKPSELWSAIEALSQQAFNYLPEEYQQRFTVLAPPRLLKQLHLPFGQGRNGAREHPVLPISRSQLLSNRRVEHSMADVIAGELRSADRVDIIMAFIRSSGVEVLREPLQFALDRGCKIRMLTSVYAQGSEARAIEALHAMGVEIRIDLNRLTSNIHAKGWFFARTSGYGTALVGSSNMSATALSSGHEWNLRISEREVPELVHSFAQVFESSWDAPQFVAFDPILHRELLHESLRKESFQRIFQPQSSAFRARPHQADALQALTIERETFGHQRNLLVSATGTGKTVTSALDYARLCKPNQARPTLLYVAHRQEILRQARDTFRAVLQDQSFGELWFGDHEPVRQTHLFASIQLLARRNLVAKWAPDTFDVVVIDEFHHAAAPSYHDLLHHLQPQQVIGLTATPDRLDGKDITQFFGGRTAYELRLWDALDDGLLAPFQYFGVSDAVDLRQVRWSGSNYDIDALEAVLVGNETRRDTVLSAIHRYIDAPDQMRALGFCVNVRHAQEMARLFDEQGLPAVALSGASSDEERTSAVARLVRGDLRVIFTVDLFNEGIDIPSVDTLLFLRPTQSVSLFSQQLGRGLRLAEGKEHCVVLDFIGQHRTEYGFESVYSVFSAQGDAAYALENNFPNLPLGCLVYLEPIAREHILQKLKRKHTGENLTWQLFDADGEPLRLPEILRNSGQSVDDFYLPKRFEAGLSSRQSERYAVRQTSSSETAIPSELVELPARQWSLRVAALTHIDDDLRLHALRNLGRLRHAESHPLLNRMLLSRLAHSYALSDHEECLETIKASPLLQRELIDLADVLALQKRRALRPFGPRDSAVLSVHATYTRIEITAALLPLTTKGRVAQSREGVHYNAHTNQDVLFVTIDKDETYYNPSVRYHDAARSKTRFRWQSQNATSLKSPSGVRYVEHRSQLLLFARQRSKIGSVTQPFYFLGEVTPVSHHGERPITFEFELALPMPQSIFHELRDV